MSYTAAIDISTFIWCEQDFNANKNQYYILKYLAPQIYTHIKELKLQILFRDDLYALIMNEFPYNMVKEFGYDLQKLTLEFLTSTFSNWAYYSDNKDSLIKSSPELSKPHFSVKIQAETESQAIHLFQSSKNSEYKFITFKHFFNHTNNLFLHSQQESIEVDTLRYNSEEEIVRYFDKLRMIFKHNPKHDRFNSGGIVSPLTCYNERTGDKTYAQSLLEKAHKVGTDLFCYDEHNNVYVQFVSTNDGTFHGFDISDEQHNVPIKIKNIFNKDGRKF